MNEPGPLTPQEDDKRYRAALGQFATGVTIITTRATSGKPVGITVSSFASVSLDPPLVLWCLGDKSDGYEYFKTAEHFCIHVLAADQGELALHFSKQSADKFEHVQTLEGEHGTPLLPGTLARFDCRKEALHPGGDHLIVVGRVLQFQHERGEPLLYCSGAFGRMTEA